MKKTIILLLAAAALAAFVPAARAASGPYVGVQGGFSTTWAGLSDLKFDSDSKFLYGARAGIKILGFAVEGVYQQTSHNLAGATGGLGAIWNGRTFDWNFYGLNAKVFMGIPVISPYFSVGYGWYGADISVVGDKTKGAFNFGAGVEIGLGRRFSILGEARYQTVKFNVPPYWLNVKDLSLVAGFNVYFL